MQLTGFGQVYIPSVPGGDRAGGGMKEERVKTGSKKHFITPEGDRELRGEER